MPTSDKKVGHFDWREANRLIASMQQFRHRAESSQDEANIAFDVDHPICVICLSDLHVGSWATDHDLLESVTDEILSTPHLYIALLGDIQQMAIKMRSVMEVADNLLPPEYQNLYVESWLNDIAHRVLFSTWGNHDVSRGEDQSGYSRLADLMKRRTIYHGGIGHVNITVGGETYRIAASHRFRGYSIYNPLHGQMRYLKMVAFDREIAMAGDSHEPGFIVFTHGPQTKLAINTGSIQSSGYGRRYFSLIHHPIFPCFEIYPDRHIFVPYWSIEAWLKSTRTVP